MRENKKLLIIKNLINYHLLSDIQLTKKSGILHKEDLYYLTRKLIEEGFPIKFYKIDGERYYYLEGR